MYIMSFAQCLPLPKCSVNGSCNCIINVILLRENKKSILFLAVFFVLSPWTLPRENEGIWGFQVLFSSFPGTEQRAEWSSREWDLGSQQLGNTVPKWEKTALSGYQFFPSLSLPCARWIVFLSTLSLVQYSETSLIASVEE